MDLGLTGKIALVTASSKGLAKTLDAELAPHHILVNNVCPGIIFTDRITQLAEVRVGAGSPYSINASLATF